MPSLLDAYTHTRLNDSSRFSERETVICTPEPMGLRFKRSRTHIADHELGIYDVSLCAATAFHPNARLHYLLDMASYPVTRWEIVDVGAKQHLERRLSCRDATVALIAALERNPQHVRCIRDLIQLMARELWTQRYHESWDMGRAPLEPGATVTDAPLVRRSRRLARKIYAK